MGILVACFGYVFAHPGAVISGLLIVPLVIDGVLQALTSYTSTNRRRLITGILFGYGLITLFLFTSVQAFLYGYHLLDK